MKLSGLLGRTHQELPGVTGVARVDRRSGDGLFVRLLDVEAPTSVLIFAPPNRPKWSSAPPETGASPFGFLVELV